MTGFIIRGLDPAPFAPLYGLDDAALAERGVVRMAVTNKPGFPCRVRLEDGEIGETMLLLNHEHLAVDTPYRQAHAIFVTEGAETPAIYENKVPGKLAIRHLSVRAYDADGMMTDADLVDGKDLTALIDHFFADPKVAYLHAHNAKRGCFAARIDRE